MRLRLLLLAPCAVLACYLQGQDSGHCANTAALATTLPFCHKYVSVYPSACLPNEYPAFPNHTATRKDNWVQAQATGTISRRIEIETTNGGGFTLRASLCACPLLRAAARLTLPAPPPLCPPQSPGRAPWAASWCTF